MTRMWELGSDSDKPEWQIEETPFDATLYEVVVTKYGPYAIGDGGTLVGKRKDKYGGTGDWEIILDDGPATRDNQLRAMAVTDDKERIWFLGSSGAVGCYDLKTRRKFDYSYPKEMTSTWEGIAVSGNRGSEKILAANGSGEVMPFTMDGFDVDWGVSKKPVSGKASKIAALAASPDGVGYAIDTSGNAFKTSAEEGWEDIGIVNAQVKFYDIYAGKKGRVFVAAGDGRIYRYDDSYHNWTPIGVADKASLRAFDIYYKDDGSEQMMVLGNDGTIYQRAGKERWKKMHSPTSADLFDVALGHPDLAIGSSGTVIVRPRGQARHEGKSKDGDNFDGRGEMYDGGAGSEGSSSDGSSSDGSTSDGSSSDGSTSDGSSN